MEKRNNNTPRICKICNRRFATGKAMGGHMRSHLLKLKLASLSSPSSTETESLTRTGRRSKRLRKLAPPLPVVVAPPSDSVSSSSSPPPRFSLTSEDAAMCLLMLSKDERMGLKCYRCESCNKSFRSHQALGGHKASHNKNKQVVIDDDDDGGDGEDDDDGGRRRVFECQFCDKVFQSGQALGGHKKVHFAYLPIAAAVAPATNTTSSSTVQSFDLNLPASDDDEEEEEVSLFENTTPS